MLKIAKEPSMDPFHWDNRFEYIEGTAEKRGLRLKHMTIDEMDELWNEVKHLKDVDV